MRKLGDITRNVREAVTHLDTALALIAQAGSDGPLVEGYTGNAMTCKLRDAKKLAEKAHELGELLATAPPSARERAS